jgi:hypothetical protein
MRAAIVLLPLLLAACSLEPVRRKVDLTPHADLPAGIVSMGHDGVLEIELGEIEPLRDEHVHAAWASTSVDLVYLGPLTAGTPLSVDPADFGLASGAMREIRVTIEERTALPLDEPSAPPVLVAALSDHGPSSLSIPGLDEGTLAGASATAVLEDARVDVYGVGLPSLPSALFYGVWLEFEAGAAASSETPGGHAHSVAPGNAAASAGHSAVASFVGRLDPSGQLDVELGSPIVEARAVAVCVEAEGGVDEQSPSCVLRGEVTRPTASESPAPAEHVH